MKIHEFFKVKKVRCVSIGNHNLITVGKEYDVVGVDRDSVFIVNDNDSEDAYLYEHFEPVLDSAENPLQGAELTPEFEAVEPKFKVGHKVYYSTDKEIYTISEIDSENSGLAYLSQNDDDWDTNAILKFCCHATPENHEMLCKLYPHIKFEAPPKPLTGSDLARAMLDKGWKYVPCYVSNTSDKNAVELDDCGVIYTVNHNGNFQDGYGETWCHAVPFDPRTGEPLTESVLND